ncbi:MAG: transporter substrate-binding domain-containing protein [Proteobacteria bacterium]|nr:transporter substrate-binding domain-containing protein [Pseudomonadota bacterium]
MTKTSNEILALARAELAPTGVLRAAINLSNFLLVTGKSPQGDPEGVSPDMASAVAERLGVPLKLIAFDNPGALADAATQGVWDIGNIGAVGQRAKTIVFTAAYAEIEATYLVPAGSPLLRIEDVDREGVRIAVAARSAYGLWLSDNIRHAQLITANGLSGSFELFVDQGLDALSGLRPRLADDLKKLPGARILDGQFTAVQQAIGTLPDRPNGAAFLHSFVEEAKASGLVENLCKKYGVFGQLTVASMV